MPAVRGRVALNIVKYGGGGKICLYTFIAVSLTDCDCQSCKLGAVIRHEQTTKKYYFSHLTDIDHCMYGPVAGVLPQRQNAP